jgi:cell division protein FtsW (lipid II flippase)
LIAVVRILGLAVAIALGAAVLAWLLTADRRWLRIAWLIFKYAVFGLLVVLLLFAGEALLHAV